MTFRPPSIDPRAQATRRHVPPAAGLGRDPRVSQQRHPVSLRRCAREVANEAAPSGSQDALCQAWCARHGGDAQVVTRNPVAARYQETPQLLQEVRAPIGDPLAHALERRHRRSPMRSARRSSGNPPLRRPQPTLRARCQSGRELFSPSLAVIRLAMLPSLPTTRPVGDNGDGAVSRDARIPCPRLPTDPRGWVHSSQRTMSAKCDPTDSRPAQPPTIRSEPVPVLGEATPGPAIAPGAARTPWFLVRRDTTNYGECSAIRVGVNRLRGMTVDLLGRGGRRALRPEPALAVDEQIVRRGCEQRIERDRHTFHSCPTRIGGADDRCRFPLSARVARPIA